MPRQVVSRPAAGRGRFAAGPRAEGDGRRRVVIDRIYPEVDGGEFPIKRTVGERVCVEALIFADGHDLVGADLLYRPEVSAGNQRGAESWRRAPLELDVNDRWFASFEVTSLGRWEYTIEAWIDDFESWREALRKKSEAGVALDVEFQMGEALIEAAANAVAEAGGEGTRADGTELQTFARRLTDVGADVPDRIEAGLSDRLAALMRTYTPHRFVTTLQPARRIIVDRGKALFSAWYELFPRSCSSQPGRHGTFDDVIARLPYVASMGFDVLYLPPIHPIGRTHRKGPNNAPIAGPDDPGSPWAIGSHEGGHTAVHPDLGTLADFDRLVTAAARAGLEIALDIAFQCSPDHPWVSEHPEWFRHRPDGSIQYAENPPKKYQDIYPLDFETDDWEALWLELKRVFDFWIDRGVRIFRVDNPHTKAFRFWDWLTDELTREHPDVILLSEAFTRPARMYRLAKGGFSQSYTYFAWRNGPEDLTEYLTELTRTEVVEYFRPSFWPNTPDILTSYLQNGGRPAAIARLVLAATLAASYGIYGPVFELCDFTPREPGSEENLNSEKYEVRHWDLDAPWSLRHVIARINRIRREHPALQQNSLLDFHPVDNPALLAYSKRTPDYSDVMLCVVNTNPFETHWGTVHLNLRALGIDHLEPFQARDLLCGVRYTWRGPDNIIGLGPGTTMAHVLHIRPSPHARSEADFDYFA